MGALVTWRSSYDSGNVGSIQRPPRYVRAVAIRVLISMTGVVAAQGEHAGTRNRLVEVFTAEATNNSGSRTSDDQFACQRTIHHMNESCN